MTRLDDELSLLRRRFPDLEFRPDGQWIRIPEYGIPEGLWRPSVVQVAFQIPSDVAAAPYGFYARPLEADGGLLEVSGAAIQNYDRPRATPWGSDWGMFSWALETWQPRTPITDGTTMLHFARSIAARFQEGA